MSLPDSKGAETLPQDWLAKLHRTDKDQAKAPDDQQNAGGEQAVEEGSPPVEEAGTSSSHARSNRKVILLRLEKKQVTYNIRRQRVVTETRCGEKSRSCSKASAGLSKSLRSSDLFIS